MPMIPPTATHQEKRAGVRKNGKPYFYEGAVLKSARQKFTAHLGLHKPDRKMDGPLMLTVTWLFPNGDSHKPGEWRTTKPDTDNIQKLLKDCMTQVGFWKDDAQVCVEQIQKLWNDTPGIYISIQEIQELKQHGSE